MFTTGFLTIWRGFNEKYRSWKELRGQVTDNSGILMLYLMAACFWTEGYVRQRMWIKVTWIFRMNITYQHVWRVCECVYVRQCIVSQPFVYTNFIFHVFLLFIGKTCCLTGYANKQFEFEFEYHIISNHIISDHKSDHIISDHILSYHIWSYHIWPCRIWSYI